MKFKHLTWISLLSGLLIIALCLYSSWHKVNSTQEVRSSVEMEEVLSKLLPWGTPMTKAKELMEKEGFKCSYETTMTWWDGQQFSNVLYCERENSGFAVSTRWRVVIKEGLLGAVGSIMAKADFTGS